MLYTFFTAVAISSSRLIHGIRNFFLLYFLVFLFLTWKLKHIGLACFITFLFGLQLVNPNKAYSIEVIRGNAILEKLYAEGYSITYFFHVATFFAVPTLGFLVKELIVKRKLLPSTFLRLLKMFGISIIGFWLVSLYSNSRFSPFPTLSYLWLFQYSFMFLVAMGFIFFMVMYPRFRNVLIATLVVICMTQSAVGVTQLILQRSIGLAFESQYLGSFSSGLDENNAVFRVFGTFMFHNQLALCMAILYSFFFAYGLKKSSLRMLSVAGLALVTIVLTQSRSTLIGIGLYTVLLLRENYEQLYSIMQRIGFRRLTFYSVVGFALSAFGIIPRILLSINTGYQGAGLSIRVRMVREGIEALYGSPLLGYGIGTNEYVLHKLFPNGVMAVFPAAIHLAFVQMMLEVGIVGLFFFFLPFLFILRKILLTQKRSVEADIYKLAFIGGSITVISYWMLLPHVGIIEFAFFGLILGFGGYWYYAIGASQEHNEKNRRPHKKN